MSKIHKGEKFDYLSKIVILGDSSVGKTNILLRFTSEQYKSTHLATIGVDFKIKTLQIQRKKMKMQLWDTAGQERFKTITETYYKGANGIVLVYSVGDRKSFNNITNWINQIGNHTQENIPKILIGNKCDLINEQRVVSLEQGKLMAQKYKMPFLQASAKQNININEIFLLLGRQVAIKADQQKKSNIEPQNRKLKNNGNTTEKKKSCC